MNSNLGGQTDDERLVRAGFIGCGSHACRNLLPTFAFTPVSLAAVCDLQQPLADRAAAKFGAGKAYTDYRRMLDRQQLDAVFVCTSYDDRGRPRYPAIAADCLAAGCHVWIEKPPAATCAELEALRSAADRAGRNVMVGLKKMFVPANEKARALAEAEDFGGVALVTIQYPQHIPPREELADYLAGRHTGATVSFLDHLCHPASLLVFLLGMPQSLFYRRSRRGAGVATFDFASGAVASMALTGGAAGNFGLERTMIVGVGQRHITVDNNLRVALHRDSPHSYGRSPDYYTGQPGEISAVWEPEFSLGQLYNKGLFLLGYWGEINEFCRSILESRPLAKGTLQQAWQVTKVFEAFAEGENKLIDLG